LGGAALLRASLLRRILAALSGITSARFGWLRSIAASRI
jgi:hypothetical protein